MLDLSVKYSVLGGIIDWQEENMHTIVHTHVYFLTLVSNLINYRSSVVSEVKSG